MTIIRSVRGRHLNRTRLLVVGAMVLLLGVAVPERTRAQAPPAAPASLSREEAARFLEKVREMTGAMAPASFESLPGGVRILHLPRGHGHYIGGIRRPDGGFTLSCSNNPVAGLEKLLLRPVQPRTDAQGRELE